jgi:hypothetical protein
MVSAATRTQTPGAKRNGRRVRDAGRSCRRVPALGLCLPTRHSSNSMPYALTLCRASKCDQPRLVELEALARRARTMRARAHMSCVEQARAVTAVPVPSRARPLAWHALRRYVKAGAPAHDSACIRMRTRTENTCSTRLIRSNGCGVCGAHSSQTCCMHTTILRMYE